MEATRGSQPELEMGQWTHSPLSGSTMCGWTSHLISLDGHSPHGTMGEQREGKEVMGRGFTFSDMRQASVEEPQCGDCMLGLECCWEEGSYSTFTHIHIIYIYTLRHKHTISITTHTCMYLYTHAHIITHSDVHKKSHKVTHSHTLTHINSHTQTLTHVYMHTISHSQHTCADSHAHKLTCSDTHIHAISHTTPWGNNVFMLFPFATNRHQLANHHFENLYIYCCICQWASVFPNFNQL